MNMDEYEQRYMQPGEAVLFREKITTRAAFVVSMIFLGVFGLSGLALLGAGVADRLPPALGFGVGLVSILFAAFMGVTGVMFSVFRTMITGSNVHVHFGWAKRKIALSAIESIQATASKGLKQGKVQIGLDGVVRTWVGRAPSGRAVEIAYTEEGGRKHVLNVGSDDAERFVETVERARARVRIAATADEVVPPSATEEEPAENAEDEARRSAR